MLRLINPLRPGLISGESDDFWYPDHADQARELIVESITLRQFRSYASLELDLGPGRTLVVGANGAGKTNLLEGLHVATQGFSPRTRAEGRLIRTGCEAARATARAHTDGTHAEPAVTLHRSSAKQLSMNGAPVSLDELRTRLPVLVFLPDRLAVVKGGPALRRTYFRPHARPGAAGACHPAR